MNSKKFLVLLFLLEIFAPTIVEAKIFTWKNPGGNPSSLGLLAIDSLHVPQNVKQEWRATTPDTVWVQKGTFLNELTKGGKNHTTPSIDDSVYCAWTKVNQLKAGRYITRQIQTIEMGDSSTQITETVYILYHFVICNNIAWEIKITTQYLPKPPPPPLLPLPPKVEEKIEEKKEEPPPPPIIPKASCLCLEVENFNSAGYTNTYPYVGTGGRVNYYPVCHNPTWALDLKMNIGAQAPYIPSERASKLSWVGMKNGTRIGLGLRVQTSLKNKALLIAYFNVEKTRYDYRWDNQLDKELEITFIYDRLKVETLAFVINNPGYLFSRMRVKWKIGKESGHLWYLGPEAYYDGDNNLKNPSYYNTRWGLVLEFFKPHKQRGGWFSTSIASGAEIHENYVASYAGIDACFGLRFEKQTKKE